MKYQKLKKRTFDIINKAEDGDLASRIFDWTIMLLIALSTVSIILESFQSIREAYSSLFNILEIITVIVFSIEYVLRIWTADLLYPKSKHPRLKYVFSFMAIVDLLAIVPFYIPFISVDLRYLRMVRMFRLFRLLRVFKLGRYFNALQIIVQVIKNSGPQLVMSVFLCLFIMLVSAIIMYSAENPVQPEKFPNIMASLWWAVCTLTTVGYGDIYPVTSVGRFFASVISLVGIGIIAIPTGIIAAGFNQVISERTSASDGEDGMDKLLDDMSTDDLLQLQNNITNKLEDRWAQNKNENEKIEKIIGRKEQP